MLNLDRDLAVCFGVETRRVNEQMKRNQDRFPNDFVFQLTKEEVGILKSQNATSSWGGDRKLPYVYTEQGVSQHSSVIKSPLLLLFPLRLFVHLWQCAVFLWPMPACFSVWRMLRRAC